MITKFFIILTDLLIKFVNIIIASINNISNLKNIFTENTYKNNDYIDNGLAENENMANINEDLHKNIEYENSQKNLKFNYNFLNRIHSYFNKNYKKNYIYNIESNFNELDDINVLNNLTRKFDNEYIENLSKRIKIDIKKIIILLISIFITVNYFLSIEIALILIIFLSMILYFIIKLPKLKKERVYSNISREIPFALRHMATELKSGKGLNDTLVSISKSNYGVLSAEFNRVINEVKYGMPLTESLENMGNRVDSESLNKVIYQIIISKKLGSNLSNSLSIIAEDTSFNMQIKLKNYAQKLNSFIMIYTFIVILIPVVFLILLIASSTIIGELIPPTALIILYVFFFPMIIIFMGFFIKKLEPKI